MCVVCDLMCVLGAGGEFGAAVHTGQAPLTSDARATVASGSTGALNDYTCGGMGAMSHWLRAPEVNSSACNALYTISAGIDSTYSPQTYCR